MRRHRSQHPGSRNSAFRCNGGGYLQPQIPGSAHEESALQPVFTTFFVNNSNAGLVTLSNSTG